MGSWQPTEEEGEGAVHASALRCSCGGGTLPWAPEVERRGISTKETEAPKGGQTDSRSHSQGAGRPHRVLPSEKKGPYGGWGGRHCVLGLGLRLLRAKKVTRVQVRTHVSVYVCTRECMCGPLWLEWLSGMGIVLKTKRSQARVRARAGLRVRSWSAHAGEVVHRRFSSR